MSPLSESTEKTAPFAAALALQAEHARDYKELAEQIRSKSPEAASVLLTMRQRQEAQLRQLMCIYGISARKDPTIARPSPPRPRGAEGAKTATESLSAVSSRDHVLERKMFVLQVVQPGLAGLMDGSVSTLAPVFAAAFATRNPSTAFLVGIAASLGAGISMGFAEALSDDGSLTGRGHPWVRGLICGAMTALGGIGHTLPFLIPRFHAAMTIAFFVVLVELAIITWVRHRYMETPIISAATQVALGGALVFGTGVLIGSS